MERRRTEERVKTTQLYVRYGYLESTTSMRIMVPNMRPRRKNADEMPDGTSEKHDQDQG